jgi:transcriptional regulator with XRE-family HTH domain
MSRMSPETRYPDEEKQTVLLLAPYVRKLRRQRGLRSETALANELGVSRSTITRIENPNLDGHRASARNYADALAYLGASPDDLATMLPASEFTDEILRWMGPVRSLANMMGYLAAHSTNHAPPDLMVSIDRRALAIRVDGAQDGDIRLLADALKAGGLMVSVPA